MIDLNYLSHQDKEVLAEECEDYLAEKNVPLLSHSYDNIILQAVKEGYELENYESLVWKHG